MKKPKQGTCTYCGRRGTVTSDHAPADCLFGSPQPSNLRTVPACKKCNAEAGRDDEYFRDTLAMRRELSDEPSAASIIADYHRSFARTRVAGYKKEFLANMRPCELMTSGGLYVGDAYSCNVDGERVARVICRTVRGLYLLNMERCLPTNCPIWGAELSRSVVQDPAMFGALDSLARTIISGTRGEDIGGVFRYRYAVVDDDDPAAANDSWWVLLFFNRVLFCAHTGSLARLRTKKGNVVA